MEKILEVAIVYYDTLNISFFKKTIGCALNQTCENYVIKVFYDSEVDFIIENPMILNIRIPVELRNAPIKIRQFIVENCCTEFLAFWDSDDYYTNDRLEKQLLEMKKNNSDLVYSNFGFIDNKDTYIEGDFFSVIKFYTRNVNLLDENYIGLGISLFRIDKIKTLLPFPNIKRLDWWLAISFLQRKYLISDTGSKILGYYRIYNDSLSSLFSNVSENDIIEEVKSKIEIYRNIQQTFEVVKRINYFEQSIIKKEFIEENLKQNRSLNPWGGLSVYKE